MIVLVASMTVGLAPTIGKNIGRNCVAARNSTTALTAVATVTKTPPRGGAAMSTNTKKPKKGLLVPRVTNMMAAANTTSIIGIARPAWSRYRGANWLTITMTALNETYALSSRYTADAFELSSSG